MRTFTVEVQYTDPIGERKVLTGTVEAETHYLAGREAVKAVSERFPKSNPIPLTVNALN